MKIDRNNILIVLCNIKEHTSHIIIDYENLVLENYIEQPFEQYGYLKVEKFSSFLNEFKNIDDYLFYIENRELNLAFDFEIKDFTILNEYIYFLIKQKKSYEL